MKRKNFRLVVLLMIFSVVLLSILQVLWLRSEYRASRDSFRRETHLVFRSTAQHLADSIFFSQVKLMPGYDSISGGRSQMFRFPPTLSDSAGFASGNRMRTLEIYHPAADTAARQVRIQIEAERTDTLTATPNQPGNFRYLLSMFSEGFSADSLGKYYRKALPENYRRLDFEIIERKADWFQHGWGRPPQERNDSLPFATGFYPFGMNSVYAANFSGVRPFLLLDILPQLLFSIFITGLILASFILVHRTLKAQQRLIEQKNDFIGNMTHELKTPVATVGVALEAMLSFDVLKNPEKTREYIEMARHELDRLGLMTEKILRTSVFDYESEIRQNKTMVDMAAVAKKVCSSFHLVAEKNHTSLVCESAGSCTVLGHAEHLTQMLYNLADNAFKYAGHGPEIRITLEGDNNHLQLTVADHGPGIAPEHHTRIFEKFYRVPSGDVHTVKGYGLGLNYVAGVVKSHGGKIVLESKPGHGAAFIVKLPKNA
ncbi:MAG: HAMP domain-containing histidine kinase [Bacteroidales bacterium]|nr:HAMP domain-containing histidine kinase [Bacteroidales bacterium]